MFYDWQTANKQKWFNQVVLVVWGPSVRLLSADKDFQSKVTSIMQDGIQVQACVVCADSWGVSEHLREMKIEIKTMDFPIRRCSNKVGRHSHF